MIPLIYYFIVSGILFSIGIYGLISKRNAIRLLFAVEIIINAALITFVAFSMYLVEPSATGQLFVMFGIALAAAEAAVALAIVINLFKNVGSVDVDDADLLKG